MKIDIISCEIKRTLAQVKTGQMRKTTANKKLNSFLELKNNELFKGQKRKIKKEVFNAKKLIKLF